MRPIFLLPFRMRMPIKSLFCLCTGLTLAGIAMAQGPDYPYKPVPFTAVRVSDGFWTPRMETNRVRTVWYDFQKCEETGRIDNFAKAGKLMKGEFRGTPFDDSDVFKVIEGAAYTLALKPDPKLDKYLDDLIFKIAAAQEPDGYLYSARTIDPKCRVDFFGPTRWSQLVGSHELYNLGHLYEAAVAHYQATGKTNLLAVAVKSADLICKTFGPGPSQLKEPPGHEEIEIGLVKLYRATGDRKYLDEAKFFCDIRGRADTHKLRGDNQQDHKPILEQTEAVGHSVRAGYLYCGVADVAALTGDAAYVTAIDRLWENVVGKKMHLTGGIGAQADGEAFGPNYDLPNASAYNETCAAIANALWNERMFLLHGDAKYIDVLERVIYNGFLSGIAMTGDRFFYPNPLENDGKYERSQWFGCSCCPVNDVRFIPEIASFIYATRGSNAYVNLFIGGDATLDIEGTPVVVKQETRYPWDGKITLTLDPKTAKKFTLNIRIPGWARNRPVPSDLYRYDDGLAPTTQLKVNGKTVKLALAENGFAQIYRTWKPGDVVTVTFDMLVRHVVAHPAVKADAKRFAVERGPLVYCAEGADNQGSVLDKIPGAKVTFRVETKPDLFGGITVIHIKPQGQGDALTCIPYYAWCHRGTNEMRVWQLTQPEIRQASHCWQADSVEACFDGKEPKSSNDQSIPRFTWWPQKGTKEWVTHSFDTPTTVSEASVYWFDDSGTGSCRVPKGWQLFYRAGSQWKPVQNTSAYETAKDRFNKITFSPVKTTALKLDVELQDGFSGGILEWK